MLLHPSIIAWLGGALLLFLVFVGVAGYMNWKLDKSRLKYVLPACLLWPPVLSLLLLIFPFAAAYGIGLVIQKHGFPTVSLPSVSSLESELMDEIHKLKARLADLENAAPQAAEKVAEKMTQVTEKALTDIKKVL